MEPLRQKNIFYLWHREATLFFSLFLVLLLECSLSEKHAPSNHGARCYQI